ncbi:MAG TPA: DUF4191 domain-containing protein [Actinomycetes bacterium]|nr:DUF4191 domain-containing protein [Actinomycetes bacterium]
MAKKTPSDRPGRFGQLRAAWTMTRKVDPRMPLFAIGAGLGVFAVLLGLGFVIGNPWTFGILGLTAGVVTGLFVFGRRAQTAALRSVEGQPGAAASVLTTLGKGWTVSPAVAVTKGQDLVHRVTGRPGIVLVAEGRPTSATNLLTAERRRVQRVAPDAPVHEILMGDGEGQVPLRKLHRTVIRLPRVLRPADVTELNYRLKALDSQRGQLPVPKGPLPKNVRMPKVQKG